MARSICCQCFLAAMDVRTSGALGRLEAWQTRCKGGAFRRRSAANHIPPWVSSVWAGHCNTLKLHIAQANVSICLRACTPLLSYRWLHACLNI